MAMATTAEEEAVSDGVTAGFAIPELPVGKSFRFVLLCPWDDPFFVGISAIEIFASDGHRIEVDSITTNAVEQFGCLYSLLSCDSCPSTDPTRMWACNYSVNKDLPIWINIDAQQPVTLAMIRVWNYNQSRVHALRGVHQLRIELDGKNIFEGEISCAYSETDEERFMGDTILFTTNSDILQEIANNDTFLNADELAGDMHGLHVGLDGAVERGERRGIAVPSPVTCISDTSIKRPRTAATRSRESGRLLDAPEASDSLTVEPASPDFAEAMERNVYKTKLFHMELTTNWGHPSFVGLAGLQFLGEDNEPVSTEGVTLNLTNGVVHEPSQLANLVNGKNLSCLSQDMCLIEFATAQSKPPMVSFAFAREVALTGVSVWNYNASPELASAGVQCAQFYVNGKAIVGSVLLRRAPGYVYFDYVQDVLFDRCHLFRPLTCRPSTRSVSAFIFQLRLLSTWGDEFYIGLNGIELYNRRNHLIQLRPQNIAAFPESVNILPSVENDPRTSDKLIDGENETKKAYHMWLTPMLPNRYARIFVIFDSPTFVSRLRIYNYRKTPERGVRHVSLSADDLIVFSGEVPVSTTEETGVLEISLRET